MKAPRLPASAPGLAERGSAPAPGAADRTVTDVLAWFSVAAFVTYVTLAILGGGGRALSVTYPAGAALVAVFCYLRNSSMYFGFVWWIWLLTPFVRRVFDLRYGFHPTSTLLLAPLLVTSISVFTLLRHRRMLRSPAYAPFLLGFAALAYAYLIGVIRQSPVAATYDLLVWLCPMFFGLHLALEWRKFPEMRTTVIRAALWGMLVVAAYGIYQFVEPPIWDRAWVVSAEMASVGIPVPFVIRIFSTVNAPGPLAVLLVCCILFGLAATQRWRYLALALGLVALLLTRGRAAWGALIVGGLIIQLRQPLRAIPRQWFALLLVLMLAAPVLMQPRFMRIISSRTSTLTNLDQDVSFKARVGSSRYYLSGLVSNPAGRGLGLFGGATKLLTNTRTSNALDSGPLEIYLTMGWIGGTLFMMSLISVLIQILRDKTVYRDPSADAAAAVAMAMLCASLFGNVFTGLSGYLLWIGVGFASAGRSYGLAYELSARYHNHPGLPARPTPAGSRPFAA